jgi:hypothetical protein
MRSDAVFNVGLEFYELMVKARLILENFPIVPKMHPCFRLLIDPLGSAKTLPPVLRPYFSSRDGRNRRKTAIPAGREP